jgi:ribonuclease BN (tRNA processing enzyme)
MKLRFLGCGDAFGSGGRFNSCFHVTTGETDFLIDCGASSMIALRRFAVDPNEIRTVFVSHLHGDHFGGLPFLILDAQLYSKRTGPLTLAGPPGLGARLTQAMELLFPGSTGVRRRFETEVIELAPGQPARVNGIAVTPYEVRHACGAPPFALRFEADGKVLAYTGDSEWTEELAAAGRGADLLIAEALFFDKPVKWHLDYRTLRAHLAEIAAKRVILTHMGPDMLARSAEIAHETAEDGLEIVV